MENRGTSERKSSFWFLIEWGNRGCDRVIVVEATGIKVFYGCGGLLLLGRMGSPRFRDRLLLAVFILKRILYYSFSLPGARCRTTIGVFTATIII